MVLPQDLLKLSFQHQFHILPYHWKTKKIPKVQYIQLCNFIQLNNVKEGWWACFKKSIGVWSEEKEEGRTTEEDMENASGEGVQECWFEEGGCIVSSKMESGSWRDCCQSGVNLAFTGINPDQKLELNLNWNKTFYFAKRPAKAVIHTQFHMYFTAVHGCQHSDSSLLNRWCLLPAWP